MQEAVLAAVEVVVREVQELRAKLLRVPQLQVDAVVERLEVGAAEPAVRNGEPQSGVKAPIRQSSPASPK